MYFIVERPWSKISTDLMRANIKYKAKRSVICCTLSTKDFQLDKYCEKTYKKTLKDLCLALIDEANIQKFTDNIYKVSFLDKKLDNLATFITYGDIYTPGSNILQLAFSE